MLFRKFYEIYIKIVFFDLKDVSCNEITHLPVQIGDMGSLRALNVRRNLLVELPKGNRQKMLSKNI